MHFPQILKKKLLTLISKMAANPAPFVRRPGHDFVRIRKLGFEQMLRILITMGKKSLNQELLRAFHCSCHTPSASAFVQQREKILPEAFEFLFHQFNQLLPPPKTYQGYQLMAVDGSRITIATNPKDAPNHLVNGGSRFNQLHLSVLFDLSSRRYEDALIQPGKGFSESRGLCTMADRFPTRQKVIFIADRGYESFDVFAHIEQSGKSYLIRAKDKNRNRKGIISNLKLPGEDTFDVDIPIILSARRTNKAKEQKDLYRFPADKGSFDFFKPGQVEYPLSIRVLRFRLPGGGYECIITNLSREHFPMEQIKELYHMRWGIETSFRELKHEVGVYDLHSKKAAYVMQEIFARLLLYNYCVATISHMEFQQRNTRYEYQVNYSVAIKICTWFLQGVRGIRPPDVERLIGKFRLPVRPGRNFPRERWGTKVHSFCYR
ncbi:IS4 family transposase [Dorea sp. D27]|uniref:IS4 family transposase n=1 Tax=Dorea sp. D27 TaxID=658665 RepID=UPI0006A02F1F|nr:IS4 family transposase [Dorea sp. D27]KMZ53670.1 transposase, IS4 family protein [Dorea sp. D27]